MALHIDGVNLQLTEAMKVYAEEKVRHLEKFGQTLLDVHMEVHVDRHHHHGDVFTIGIQVKIPKSTLNTSESAETFHMAVDAVIHELEHQFEKLKGRREGRLRRISKSRRLMKVFQPWKWRGREDNLE
ncbi:MAG: ribosome-associated translation inhibitor RaiA [Candidatus Kerfeldbacteria bacterium]|nr:ribosome-associated translation inhibitor RaiA [Candidatus Kerfeldbacteria bacterium]